MVKRVRSGVVGTRYGNKVSPQYPQIPGHRASLTVAGAGSNPASSPYKSKLEASYAAQLDLEQKAGLVKRWWYEPFSLWLPGKVRYKPDFLIQYPDGLERRLEVIEVKGWSRNVRDGMTRLKIAAAIFSCFTWRLVRRTKGGGWDGEYL